MMNGISDQCKSIDPVYDWIPDALMLGIFLYAWDAARFEKQIDLAAGSLFIAVDEVFLPEGMEAAFRFIQYAFDHGKIREKIKSII